MRARFHPGQAVSGHKLCLEDLTIYHPHARQSVIRRFLETQPSAGIVLMVASIAELPIANAPLAAEYNAILHADFGPLSLGHWINDGLMPTLILPVVLVVISGMIGFAVLHNAASVAQCGIGKTAE